MFLSCLDNACPCDLDDVLSYRMPRQTYLQHRVLGFTQLSLTVVVILYIAVIELWYNKGYAVQESPVGVSRITAMRPPWIPLPLTPSQQFPNYCCDPTNATPTATGCHNNWASPVGLPAGHRQRLPCLAWDAVEMTQPSFEEYSMLLATRVTVTEYSNVGQTCRLNVDNECNTAMTLRSSTKRDYYVTDPESVEVMMQHTIYSPGIGNIRQSSGNARPDDILYATMNYENGDEFMNFCVADLSDSMNPNILVNQRRGSTHVSEQDKDCGGDNVRKSRWGDILSVGQLLQTLRIEEHDKCNAGLDCPNTFAGADSYRFDGITILLPMIFSQADGSKLSYVYEPKWIRGQETESKYKTQKWIDGKETTMEYRGVRVQVVHVGTVGQFAFIEVLKTFVAGLSLLGIASFIIERIILVLPCWGGAQHLFNRYVYIHSHDFSEVIWEENHKDPDCPTAKYPTTTGSRVLNDDLFTRGNTVGRYQGAHDGRKVRTVCCGLFRAAPDQDDDKREADYGEHMQHELDRMIQARELEREEEMASKGASP